MVLFLVVCQYNNHDPFLNDRPHWTFPSVFENSTCDRSLTVLSTHFNKSIQGKLFNPLMVKWVHPRKWQEVSWEYHTRLFPFLDHINCVHQQERYCCKFPPLLFSSLPFPLNRIHNPNANGNKHTTPENTQVQYIGEWEAQSKQIYRMGPDYMVNELSSRLHVIRSSPYSSYNILTQSSKPSSSLNITPNWGYYRPQFGF